jgi:hypothetical protein
MIQWILAGLAAFLILVWTAEWRDQRKRTRENRRLRREAQLRKRR